MSLTAKLITGTIIFLGIYDLLAVTVGGMPLSISRFMQNSALEAPFIAFSVGFTCGHIFGYMPPKEKRKDSE
tara:strand:- start:1519 stop:1734 length:216 start_codon:yes stop_codon:yes gene_type:complete